MRKNGHAILSQIAAEQERLVESQLGLLVRVMGRGLFHRLCRQSGKAWGHYAEGDAAQS